MKKRLGFRLDAGSKDPLLRTLAACCFGLSRCVEILDHGGLILSVPAADEASKSLLLHLCSTAWLAGHLWGSRIMIFKLRPKHHYLQHQAADLKVNRLNLRTFQTFDDASFLGKLKRVACRCHGKTMQWRVFQRYLLAFSLFLHQSKKRSHMG